MAQSTLGTVFLVGAGPGDPELISVKGQRLLDACDAVVFDNLIPLELVVGLRDAVKKVYVGKLAGAHTLPQEDINRLLVELAGQYPTVVRLKGGDPFVFGRGGEEAMWLKRHGVRYEIVPGITSGVAAPAYAGIPCTDRQHASFCTFATGHKADHKDENTVPWDVLAKGPQGTLVIYMGVGELARIQAELLQHGMNPDTPAAIIERGTFASQKTITTCLENLGRDAEAAAIRPPAIVMIGGVATLRDELKWFEDRPLSGTRIMVTRPKDQAGSFYASLRALGAEVLPYPTIEIRADSDEAGWSQFPLDTEAPRWLAFTSENGVRFFLEQFLQYHEDIRHLAGFKIAAIGMGTRNALKDHGLACDFVPPKATVADLAQHMTRDMDLRGATVVRVRGNLGDRLLENSLAEKGALVLPLAVYQTRMAEWVPGAKERLLRVRPNLITFTSSSTIDGLFANLTSSELEDLCQGALIGSIGPSTSAHARAKGLKVAFEATRHDIPGLTAALLAFFGHAPHPTDPLPYILGS